MPARRDPGRDHPHREILLSARVRKLVANDLPHLLGCDRLFDGAQVLPERLVDERLISDTRPRRLRLECSDDLIVDVDGDAGLSLRWHRWSHAAARNSRKPLMF
jgi:hypothetical protein